jgi:hypothetical protein
MKDPLKNENGNINEHSEKFNNQQLTEQELEEKLIEEQLNEDMSQHFIDAWLEEQMVEQQLNQTDDQLIFDQLAEDQYMSQFMQNSLTDDDLSILDEFSTPLFHMRKGVYEYFAFTSYLPVRYSPNQKEKLLNRIVYSFKSGDENVSKKISQMVKGFINNQFDLTSELIFMIIPASTKHKNSVRFEKFIRNVCDDAKILNGFEGLNIIEDRPELKGKAGVNKVCNLQFNPDIFKGKHVILFDDVITSGQSFLQVSDILIQKGADQVTGLFIAKTICK